MTLGVPAAAAMLKTFFYLSRHHEILKIPLLKAWLMDAVDKL